VLINAVEGRTILGILGSPNDLKFRSSMTLSLPFRRVRYSPLSFRNSTAETRLEDVGPALQLGDKISRGKLTWLRGMSGVRFQPILQGAKRTFTR
jgi:hypothetical protein